MSEEELEVLITLDDPGDVPEEDTFHLKPKNTPEIQRPDECLNKT